MGGGGVEQVDGVAAKHGGAGRLDADDGDVLGDEIRELADSPAEDPFRRVELPGGDPGQRAAQLSIWQPWAESGVLEYGHRRLGDLRGEPVGEAVDEQQHRLALVLPAPAEPPPTEGLGGEDRYPAPMVNAGQEQGQSAEDGKAQHAIRDPGEPAGQPCPPGKPSQGVVRSRPQPAPVALVQHLGLVGGHVDAGGAVGGAALAGQTEVQGLVYLRRPPVEPFAADQLL